MMYNETAFMPHKVTAVEGGDGNCTLELDVGSGGYITPPRPPVFTPAASDFCPRCWDAGQHEGCPACGKTLPVFKLPLPLSPLTAHDMKRAGQREKIAAIELRITNAILGMEHHAQALNEARAQLELVRRSL